MNFLLIFTIICSFAIIQQTNAQECQGLNSNCDDGFLSQNCCSGLECVIGDNDQYSCHQIKIEKIQGEWAQCGGKNFPTNLQCSIPLTCVYDNEWYSQCKFIQVEAAGFQARYSQCGGLGYQGNKVCYPGLECIFQGDYWSSCELVLKNEEVQEETNGDEVTTDEGDSAEQDTEYMEEDDVENGEDTNTENSGEATENSEENTDYNTEDTNTNTDDTENSEENTDYNTEDTNADVNGEATGEDADVNGEATGEDADQTYYTDDETEDAITDESGN